MDNIAFTLTLLEGIALSIAVIAVVMWWDVSLKFKDYRRSVYHMAMALADKRVTFEFDKEGAPVLQPTPNQGKHNVS